MSHDTLQRLDHLLKAARIREEQKRQEELLAQQALLRRNEEMLTFFRSELLPFAEEIVSRLRAAEIPSLLYFNTREPKYSIKLEIHPIKQGTKCSGFMEFSYSIQRDTLQGYFDHKGGAARSVQVDGARDLKEQFGNIVLLFLEEALNS
ncbi:hypothetical protein [Deinococcus cellulosilyticus]|uniref:Uncharacterized protein n=1 Tax=Deinococcus cellulosilyticus (strain DSM 18568 / NBRC 106333 / KACC 11606 / 5516J-15) TaxID=1223518 RepID=A0A511MVK4_DEIC1|nr:hypothetical protein [Deinococcus cellulosilyticus]GEM44600.1 hypothetical protein DC3_02350 [Deinococcus cellulosilyticus NBRC 106333 = KACC 11606]